MNRLYRILWLFAAFFGGTTVIGIIAATLKITKRKYIEV